jgi:hypothetical protein
MQRDVRTQDPLTNRNEKLRELLRDGQEVRIDYQGRIVDSGALTPVNQANYMTIPSGVLA